MRRQIQGVGAVLLAGGMLVSSGCNNEVDKGVSPMEPEATRTVEQGACNPTNPNPTITASNKVGECISGEAAVEIDPNITASCDLTPTTTFSLGGQTIQDGHTYSFGNHLVRITSTDDIANTSASKTVGIQVRDTLQPIVTSPPDKVGNNSVECVAEEGTIVNLGNATANDACDNNLTLTNNAPDDNSFTPGTHTVRWTATDSSGNQGVATQTVVVRDTSNPTITVGGDFVVPSLGDCAFDPDGINGPQPPQPGAGTTVRLPFPTVSDTCTATADIGILQDVTNSPERTVCLLNNNTTEVTWTAIDTSGNRASVSFDVSVVQGGLDVNITNAPPEGWTNGNARVDVEAVGAAAPVAWQMIGGAEATTPPGNGTQTGATFADEGLYCPLYISAIDNNDDRGANNNPCFGIERTAPNGSYDAIPTRFINPENPNETIDVDANDADTWPVFFAGERLRVELQVNDADGGFRSGLRNVSMIFNPTSDDPRVLLNKTYQLGGDPATGAEQDLIIGCDTDDDACDDDGRINLASIGSGEHTIELRITDAAGNVKVQERQLRVVNYGELLGLMQDWTQAVSDNSNLSSRTHLKKAKDLFVSGSNLFLTSPGFSFLITKRAMLRLADAENSGASVTKLRELLARGMSAEVSRLVEATKDRNFTDWDILGNGPYKNRRLLTGREIGFTVGVEDTLSLITSLSDESREKYEEGRFSDSVDSSIKSFNQMAILYDDQTFATAFERNANLADHESLDRTRTERIFRSDSNQFGKDVAVMLRNQVERVAEEETLPTDVVDDLNEVRDLMDQMLEGSFLVGANAPNYRIVEEVFMPAMLALEKFETLQDAFIYTHYWRAGLVYVMTYVTNFSLYQGPTSFVIQWQDEVNDDDKFKVAECRYDRAVQAAADGRLAEGIVRAASEFTRSKCLMLDLFNSYYPSRFERERAIDVTAYGCAEEFEGVVVEDECTCGLGEENLDVVDTCNGVDDDCDQLIDEDFVAETCGNGGCERESRCVNGQVLPCVPAEPLSTTDTTCDGVDDDCDGQFDEDFVAETCGQFGCQDESSCVGGNIVACVPRVPGVEVCDGDDNNCDGRIDEGLDDDQDGVCGEDDCDDTNPNVNPDAPELCDGIDNNCGGGIDEGVLNACGNCDPRCTTSQFGVGDNRIPFSPTNNNSQNITPDDDGQLALATDDVNVSFAWFVSTGTNTVYKIDTQTGDQVGRYPVGSNSSRTTVDDLGNVFVANRGSSYNATLTKIANFTPACDTDVRLCQCPDKNNNGTIETSRDRNGNGKIEGNEYIGTSDECYMWTTGSGTMGHYARSMGIDRDGFVWVGDYASSPRMRKVHPDTGQVLQTIALHTPTYGLVIDQQGFAWTVDRNVYMQGVNTANGSLTPVYRWGPGGGGYGIGLDGAGRIWLASLRSSYHSYYFKPSTRTVVRGPTSGWRTSSRGITVSPDAVTIWGTHWYNTHYVTGWRLDPNNERVWQLHKDVYLPGCSGVIGVGVGFNNNLWVACYYNATTAVFSPEANNTTANYHAIGPTPYTYSDFTGNLRAQFTAPQGEYAQVFNGCPSSHVDEWDKLTWTGNTPGGSRIEVYIKVAATTAALDVANEQGPFTANTIDISSFAGDPNNFISVRFKLLSDDNGAVPSVTTLDVTRFCDLNINQGN